MSNLKLLSGSDENTALSIVPVGVQPTLPPNQGDIVGNRGGDNKPVIYLRAADCKSLVVSSGIGFDLAQYCCWYEDKNSIRYSMLNTGWVPNPKTRKEHRHEVARDIKEVDSRREGKLQDDLDEMHKERVKAVKRDNLSYQYTIPYLKGQIANERIPGGSKDKKALQASRAKRKEYARQLKERIEESYRFWSVERDEFWAKVSRVEKELRELKRSNAESFKKRFKKALKGHSRYPERVWGVKGVELDMNELSDGVQYSLTLLEYAVVDEDYVEIDGKWVTRKIEEEEEIWEGVCQDDDSGYGVWKLDEPYKGQKYLITPGMEHEVGIFHLPGEYSESDDVWMLDVAKNPAVKVLLVGEPEEALCLMSQGIPALPILAIEAGRTDWVSLENSLKYFAEGGRTFQFAFNGQWYNDEKRLPAILKLRKLLKDAGCKIEVLQFGVQYRNVSDTVMLAGVNTLFERVANPVPDDVFFLRHSPQMDVVRAKSTKQGQIEALIREVYAPMVSMDAFSLELLYGGRPVELSALTAEMSEILGFSVKSDSVVQQLIEVGSKKMYNRIANYLDTVAAEYPPDNDVLEHLIKGALGINNTIEAVYVLRWLVSAVARSYEPGCKADAALILVGKEGLFKTTFFEVLAGKENFASLSGDVGDRKFLMVMRKNWIVELGEIDAAFRTNDWGRLKGFITNAVDKYVLPYGTKGLDFPRIGVLAGTTNYEKPLRDVNSEFRRYWCIRVERHIDTEWITENRDRIWAAITHLYRGGMQWWLTPEEEEAHKSHALNFSAESSYFEKLLRLLPTSRTIKVAGKQVTIKWAEDSFLISDLCDALGVSGRGAEMGVGNDLRRLGFDKKQMRGYGGKTNYWYLADPDKMQVTALPELDMDNLLRQAD